MEKEMQILFNRSHKNAIIKHFTYFKNYIIFEEVSFSPLVDKFPFPVSLPW